MRRKKDNKRVLRPGNGRKNNRSRRTRNLSFKNRNNSYPPVAPNKVKKQKKRSGKTVLLMVIVLVAFIVGAGIGILMSFDDGSVDKNETHYKNVTVEMTTNLNDTPGVVFNESDDIDFNENRSSDLLDVEKNPYYNYTGPG